MTTNQLQTARISLSGVILEMRQAERDFEAISSPACAQPYRSDISKAMESAVNGFNSFLGESEFEAYEQLHLATEYFADVYYELQTIGIVGDIRMSDTAGLIWGGDSPNPSSRRGSTSSSSNPPQLPNA